MPVALRPFQAELERRVYEAWNYCANHPLSRECRNSLSYLQQEDQWYASQVSQFLSTAAGVTAGIISASPSGGAYNSRLPGAGASVVTGTDSLMTSCLPSWEKTGPAKKPTPKKKNPIINETKTFAIIDVLFIPVNTATFPPTWNAANIC